MKKAFIIIGVVLLAIPLLWITMAFAAIGGEYFLIKEDLENTYIDDGYKNWMSVSLPNTEAKIKIPNTWTFAEYNDQYCFKDQSGTIVAVIMQKETEDMNEQEENEFLANVLSIDAAAMERSYQSNIHASHLYTITANGAGQVCAWYLSLTDYDTPKLHICFLSEDEQTEEIAEAIMYSFEFYEHT